MTAEVFRDSVDETLGSESPIEVSVIVPVFNAEACIRSSLMSVLVQEGVHLELIVVNDGSEDATGRIVDAIALEDPRVQVVHQENSGWAGGPRNRGFDLARGEYVLYLDADDALVEGALADLVRFARANSSDIVVPRSASDRRKLHEDVFARTRVSAPLQVLCRNNYTCKLFRRELLLRAGIRFSDVPIRLEDAIFCFRAYAASARTSILADRVLHRIDAFESGTHISMFRIEPYGYVKSVDQSLKALSDGDQRQKEKDAAVADFFRRVVLTRFGEPTRHRTRAENDDWRRAMEPLARYWAARCQLAEYYGPLNRARLHSLVAGRAQVLRSLVEMNTKSVSASAAYVSCSGTYLMFDVAPILGSKSLSDVRVELSRAHQSNVQTLRPVAVDAMASDQILGTPRYRVKVGIPMKALRDQGSTRIFINAVDDRARRIRVRVVLPEGVATHRKRVGAAMVTVSANRKGELLVRVQSILRAATSGVARLLRRVPVIALSRRKVPSSGALQPRLSSSASAINDSVQAGAVEQGLGPIRPVEVTQRGDVFATHRHVAVTWNIPANFGGMTTVLFRRSRLFAHRTTRPVDVLVLAPGFVPDEWLATLRGKGLFDAGMRLRGLWSELAAMTDEGLAGIGRLHQSEADDLLLGHSAVGLGGDETEREEHLRSDGSLLAIERRVDGRKELLLISREGKVVAVFYRRRDLYFAWIKVVLESDPAVVLTDSKVVASYMHELNRPHTAVGQVFHSTHLNAGAPTAFGPMNPYHLAMIQNVDSYDMTVILTERQRADFNRAMDAGDALVTIPNSLDLTHVAHQTSGLRRHQRAGAIVSRLETEKRLEDAVTAVARARTDVRLAIYGSGEEEQRISELIDDLGATDYIHLAGFDSSIPARLAESSFLLLSSRFEGLPLVLVEAMAAGCIPIAYDIRFGPRDIITDGVNGFLVPDGDVDGLTRAIETLLAMSSQDLNRMRESARARARDFDDGVIADRWADALAGAVRRRQLRAPAHCGTKAKLAVTDVTASLNTDAVRLTLHGAFDVGHGRLALDVVGRKKAPFVLSRHAVSTGVADSGRIDFTLDADFFAAPAGVIYDFFLRNGDDGPGGRVRIAAPASLIDAPQVTDDLRLYATVKGNLSVEKLS